MDKKYIDVEDVMSILFHLYDIICGNDGRTKVIKAYKIMQNFPAADVQEVRHGKWKGYTRSAFHGMDDFGNPIYRDVNIWECSECCRKSVIKENYCPCCGARMDGEEND